MRCKPKFGVRLVTFASQAHSGQRYEVYRIETGETVHSFEYKTESDRGKALGLANATRNDLNG